MKMRKGILTVCFVATLAGAQQHATVTAHAGACQEFGGLGVNLLERFGYSSLPAPVRTETCRLLFGPGKFTWFRIWDRNQTAIRDAMAAGCKNFMTESVQAVPSPISGCPDNNTNASILANEAKSFRDAGVPIRAIGWSNKCNTCCSATCRRDPYSIPDGVKKLRTNLDNYGLEDILIIAPETTEWWPRRSAEAGKYDFKAGDNMLYLKALAGDPDAVDALGAFATQTYGTGVTQEMQELVAATNKPYWQTLSWMLGSGNAHTDTLLGPSTAGALMSDLNHGVSTWFFWTWSDVLDLNSKPATASAVKPFPRYYFMTAISEAFDVGAQFRRCSLNPATPNTDMHWNYERDHTVMSTVARNPDGTWSIAVLNLTGLRAQMGESSFDQSKAKPYEVGVAIDELSNLPSLAMQVRSVKGAASAIQEKADATMKGGKVTLTVEPLELVVLQTRNAPLVHGTPMKATHTNTIQFVTTGKGQQIQYTIAKAGMVKINVMDVQGRIEKTLANQNQKAGVHTITWEGKKDAQGVYFVQMVADEIVQAKRIVMVK